MKVIFYLHENTPGVVIWHDSEMYFFPAEAIIPFMKLGKTVGIGTVEDKSLFAKFQDMEITLYLEDKKYKVWRVDEESKKRLEVFADMLDDVRFLYY